MNSALPAVGRHCSRDRRSPVPPAQGARRHAGGRRGLSATVRSRGGCWSSIPVAGGPGRQVTGAGDEGRTGEAQLEQEGRRSDPDRRRSIRGGRGCQGGKRLPVWAAEVSSRPRRILQLPEVGVRSVRASSAARGRWDRLHAILRSFLSAWSGVSATGGADG